MASGQIRMTPDTMRERAGEYRTEAENVQSVIDKMDRLLETLLTEWEGSASEAYANKFAELRPLFVKVYQNKRRSNMASLLERLKYIIEDIFGKKTYAESQRDKYKKVVRNLEKELKKTDNLSDVMAQLATDYNTMEMNPDSAQGKLSDTFVTKESENREAVEKLGADFKEIIAEVKSKLEFARDEYNYWCDEAKREDEEMKIYQQQYYEEEERLRREAAEEEARRKREAS